jgi:membrane fusion protein (multidrug efflux system)
MNEDPIDPATLAAPADVAIASRPGRRLLVRAVFMGLLPLLAVLALLAWYLHGGGSVETDNAYVKSDKIAISAEVAGPVTEVLVRDNEAVAAGRVLFRLDPAPYRVALAEAEAKVAQVRNDLAALAATHRQKQAEIILANTRLAFARQEQLRQADLVARGFVSSSRFDEARQASDLAAQQLPVLEQELQRIAVTLGGRVDAPIARHPSMLAARAELDRAQLDLARTEVRAALPGVASRPPRQGQFVSVGSAVMALVVSATPWVEANFSETDLSHLRAGQPAEIHIDTYPGLVWHGTVDSLSPATGAEFSLIPAQNATGNWVKVVQRVPVRIQLDSAAEQPPLRAGLSAVVTVRTGQRRQLLGLAWPRQ